MTIYGSQGWVEQGGLIEYAASLCEVLVRAGATAAQVQHFGHGMTVATNALLEERGARTALVTTAGFA